MSDSVRPHRWQSTRLLHPWDSPGKNTGVGCHFLLHAWKWKVKVKSLSHVRLLATPWTAAHQAPLPMGFSRQEYWSGVPSPSPLLTLERCKKKRGKKWPRTTWAGKGAIFYIGREFAILWLLHWTGLDWKYDNFLKFHQRVDKELLNTERLKENSDRE